MNRSSLAKSQFQLDEATTSHPTADECFSGLNWDFPIRPRAAAIEGIHPYPAKFIGDIPRTLLERLPIPSGTKVFDPFCGSGTTMVEAQRAGRKSIGIDLNPIACLLSRVKTSPLIDGILPAATDIVARARVLPHRDLPSIPNLSHWFMPHVSHVISGISEIIAKPEYEKWFDPLRLALSSIIVRVSNQDSDTRYAAVKKTITEEDVFDAFISAIQRIERALVSRNWPLATANVIEGDTLTINSNTIRADVGIVITSPPYPNAYEYWLYHKYRMWWLGFDPLAVKDREIGARAHFFKKNPHSADLFVKQMSRAFDLISAVLVTGGFACFVVGRSKIHGKLIDNAEIIERVSGAAGFKKFARFERHIKASRKSFNLSHANIKTETVLVLQRL